MVDIKDKVEFFDSDNASVTVNQEEQTMRVKLYKDTISTAEDVRESYDSVVKSNKEAQADGKAETTFMIDLKEAPLDKKVEIITMALNYPDLQDPLMLLNILNLVKVYNTLDDTYFQSPDIYVNSVEELLDLKLALAPELKKFSQQITKYFFGLVKSYSKIAFTPADEHVELPNIFKQLFMVLDLATISSILAKSASFSTEEITYIDNAYVYMSSIISRSNTALDMIEDFYKEVGEKKE